MRNYGDLIALAKEPHQFDNVKYATPDLIDLVENVLLPYVNGQDTIRCLARLMESKVEPSELAVIFMLSLMKRDSYTYSPELIGEYSEGIAEFAGLRSGSPNALARESTRLVAALYNEALTTIQPHEFVLMLVSNLQKQFVGSAKYKNLFLPQVWAPDALDDPATQHLGRALEEILLCYPELIEEVEDDRLSKALKHYPTKTLKPLIKHPKHQDQMLSVDLGL
ncbi:hypothetical protein [Pseudomonas sp. CFBP 13719]|uniref:hypothetical protein n=1 Tax=Pseudomonas sp. CFBP 13719 TaxID=2775303 RepID=UPI00177EA2F9|nr:hypothetical protein [Pseudomonas sp. CFBP 13719]MBD8681647.1 hypothetical protein [Pseudomonas sp. CFBP 13719]